MFDNCYEEFDNAHDCPLSLQMEEQMQLDEQSQEDYSPYSPFFESNDANKRNMTEAEGMTTNQKTNSNNNIKYNNIINQNNNISIENNVLKKEITFLSKKHNLTPKKKEKRRKNGESKKRNGNAINKITNSCIYNMHYFIKKLYKNINVDKPTTSNIEKKSYEEKGKLLNKTIYELYCENIMTKRFKGDKDIIDVDKNKQTELKREAYKKLDKNKVALDNFLKDNNLQNIMFFKEIKFRDFMASYLNNEKTICKRDEKNNVIFGISLTGFETYDQSFNGEYTPEEKNKYKNKIIDIINGRYDSKKKKFIS